MAETVEVNGTTAGCARPLCGYDAVMIKVMVITTLTLLATLATAAPPKPVQFDNTAAALREEADKGNGNAALQLGNLLALGRVPVARFGLAADWYRKGCELGELSGCHNAGYAYETGTNGVAKDTVEAAAYYRKAAEHAFLPSMINLGSLYATGAVISMDDVEGYKWLLIARLAANQCAATPMCLSVIEDSRGHREKMKSRLSESQQRAAEKMAMDWQPK